MAYDYGVGSIKQNNYEIYIREQRTAETLTYDRRLLPMVAEYDSNNDIEVIADGTEQGDDFKSTGASKFHIITGTDSSVCIFDADDMTLGSGEWAIVIAQESGLTAGDTLTNNITFTDLDEADYVISKQGAGFIIENKSVAYYVSHYNVTGLQNSEYTRIGGCEEKPTVKTSEGSSIKINNGDTITTSENLEINITDLQVDADNYSFIRAFGNVDIILYDSTNIENTILIYDVRLESFVEASGNDLNKNMITINLETDNVDNHVNLYSGTQS